MPTEEQILFEGDTPHEHYQVVERRYEGRPSRVLFSGRHRAAQSGIGLDDNPDLLFDYNQRLLELANGIYPKQVLVIGGGAFTLPMALAAALPEVTITTVEIDEGLLPIAERFFGLKPSPQMQLHFGDGREFLTKTTDTYDMIIIDVFSELAIPRPFLSVEFVELVHSRLKAGGCVAMNIIASYQGRNAGLIKSQAAAYNLTFDKVDIFPAAYGLTSWLPQNLIVVAQRRPTQSLQPYVRFAAIPELDTDKDDIYHDGPPGGLGVMGNNLAHL